MTTTARAVMTHVCPPGYGYDKCSDKITVIGAGTVGTSIAFALLAQVF